jgi:hypothetical protein
MIEIGKNYIIDEIKIFGGAPPLTIKSLRPGNAWATPGKIEIARTTSSKAPGRRRISSFD